MAHAERQDRADVPSDRVRYGRPELRRVLVRQREAEPVLPGLGEERHERLHIVRFYIERESAKQTGRPVYNEMLRRIEAGEAAGIVAWHPDRLARNAVDGGRIIELLDKRKLVALKFPSFWFENNPQGRFMLMMAFAQSAHYVDALSVNTKSGLDRKVARGDFPGQARVGYLNNRRTKRIVADRERAPVIRELFERYATGSDTLDDLRAFLFSRGIGAGRGAKKPMNRFRVGRILADPIYCGLFRWNGEIHRGNHEPIISRELYDRAQAVRERRVKYLRGSAALKPFAYRRTLVCGGCGGAVTAESQKGHTYYRCSRKVKRAVRCAEPYIREEALDRQIRELLRPFTLPSGWADEMLARVEAERVEAAQSAVSLIDENCRKIDTINASLITLQDGLVDGLFDHDYVRAKREDLVATRRELEARNAALSNDSAAWLEPFREFVSTARNIGETVSKGTKEARAELARKIFGSNLFLTNREARGVAVKPWTPVAVNECNSHWVRVLGFEPRTPSVSVMCSTN